MMRAELQKPPNVLNLFTRGQGEESAPSKFLPSFESDPSARTGRHVFAHDPQYHADVEPLSRATCPDFSGFAGWHSPCDGPAWRFAMLAYEAHRRPTRHYEARAAERALRPDVAKFLLVWGTETCAAGAIHLTLVRRDHPIDLRDSDKAVRAEGWIIVAGDDGPLVTCYRRNDAWRFVRRKSQLGPRRFSRRVA